MKKLFLLIAFFYVTSFAKSQGNLQFNQVLTITSGQSYTVPTGKVLKIESINITSTSVCVPKSSEVVTQCRQPSGSYVPQTYGIYNSISYMTIANMNFTTPSYTGGNNNAFCPFVNSSCWNWDFSQTTFILLFG
jgi:hypothetical protein